MRPSARAAAKGQDALGEDISGSASLRFLARLTEGSGPVLRATRMRESAGHGISASIRRHSQTVLSKIFSTGLLMFRDPSSLLYANHGGVPALLKPYTFSTVNPCDSN